MRAPGSPSSALTLFALTSVLARSVYLKGSFADRTASALQDPGVREFVSDRVTDALIGQRPDLVAVRPFVLSAVHGLVGTRPFEGLVRQAAGQAHNVVFSEGVERVVVAFPDVGVLVREVLERASPALAEKIPPTVPQSLATVSEGRTSGGLSFACNINVPTGAVGGRDDPGGVRRRPLVLDRGAAGWNNLWAIQSGLLTSWAVTGTAYSIVGTLPPNADGGTIHYGIRNGTVNP